MNIEEAEQQYHGVVIGSLVVIGKLSEDGKTLLKPRVTSYIEGGKQILMLPFPGLPASIPIDKNLFVYEINKRDRPVIDLYEKVTSREAEERSLQR